MKALILILKVENNYMRNGRCDFVSWCGCQWWPVQAAKYATKLLHDGAERVQIIDAQAWNLSDIECGRMISEICPDEIYIYNANCLKKIDLRICTYLQAKYPKWKTKFLTYTDCAGILPYPYTSVWLCTEIPEKYHKCYVAPSEPYPFIDMITSAGCPWGNCSFCSSQGVKYQELPAEKVVDEMEYIQESLPFSFKSIMMQDDSITEKRAMAIVNERLERKLVIPWSCYARPNLSKEVMKMMKIAGCINVHVGFESGDDTILAKYHKGVTTRRMEIFMRDAREVGLKVHGDFMLSFTETDEQIKKTIEFACKLRPDTAQFQQYIFQSELGTELPPEERIRRWQFRAYRKFYGNLSGIKIFCSQIGKPKIITETLKSCIS